MNSHLNTVVKLQNTESKAKVFKDTWGFPRIERVWEKDLLWAANMAAWVLGERWVTGWAVFGAGTTSRIVINLSFTLVGLNCPQVQARAQAALST